MSHASRPSGDDPFDEVVDPDVDLHDPSQRHDTVAQQWQTVGAVSAGGVVGACARYGLSLAVPHRAAAFPWATLITNAGGCLLIGALMVVLLELASPHRLVRPFLGVGILGGYTTFSTFAVDAQNLLAAHRPVVALAYVLGTLVLCLVAVWTGTAVTSRLGRSAVPGRPGGGAR